MKIMMLGGGTNQLCAINRILENGHDVVVSDYLDQSPGKNIASYTAKADTFSYEETLREADRHNIDAILTVGTDQPVLTAAKVAKQLDLASGIGVDTALAVTNKEVMKKIFVSNNIPTIEYILIDGNIDQTNLEINDIQYKEIENMTYPAVLKPVDSQGQRGIFKVNNPEQVWEHIKTTLSYSKAKKALLEKYYENQEVTVSGWVKSRRCYILTMTDRVTFDEEDRIGVCVSHEHPSIHIKEYGTKAKELTEQIVAAFNISDGPIYFQFLIGESGMLVNEIACRIGGAYEDQFIPKITGFDILNAQIDLSLGRSIDLDVVEHYDFRKNEACVSVQLFFAQPGKLEKVTSKDEMMQVQGIDDFRCHYKNGDEIPEIENASARAGFGLLYGSNENAICERINEFFKCLKLENDQKENLVIAGRRGNR